MASTSGWTARTAFNNSSSFSAAERQVFTSRPAASSMASLRSSPSSRHRANVRSSGDGGASPGAGAGARAATRAAAAVKMARCSGVPARVSRAASRAGTGLAATTQALQGFQHLDGEAGGGGQVVEHRRHPGPAAGVQLGT